MKQGVIRLKREDFLRLGKEGIEELIRSKIESNDFTIEIQDHMESLDKLIFVSQK